MLYQTFLLIHSWLRWPVILFGLLVVIFAVSRLSSREADGRVDRFGLLYMITLDLQLLLGVLLYVFFTPWLGTLTTSPGAAMGARVARYWTVEHGFGMILAIVFAHVARIAMRKAPDAARKHRKAMIWFGLSLIVLLATLPWPFMAYARPLFRMG